MLNFSLSLSAIAGKLKVNPNIILQNTLNQGQPISLEMLHYKLSDYYMEY